MPMFVPILFIAKATITFNYICNGRYGKYLACACTEAAHVQRPVQPQLFQASACAEAVHVHEQVEPKPLQDCTCTEAVQPKTFPETKIENFTERERENRDRDRDRESEGEIL